MTTLVFSSLSQATLKDINEAFATRGNGIIEVADWIYSVDPETMQQVKAFYLKQAQQDGTLSLSRVFNEIARYTIKNNITW